MGINNPNNLLSNLKVLLVEDEEFARVELSKFLKRRVGKLYVGRNGEEGLKLYKEHNPEIIVTDLKMPKMDGLEMAKNIKDLGYSSSIIITSAMSDSETILKAVDIGIVKYVIKPVNTEELIYNMEKIASDILKYKLNKEVINDSVVLDREKKKELEQKVRGEAAYFIKSITGKGPQNVNVFIGVDNIEIRAKGVLTLLEDNLISNNRNHTLVNYNRRLLYMENKKELEHRLGHTIGTKVTLLEAEGDSKNNTDIIKFSYL